MPGGDPVIALADFIEPEAERIVKRWASRVADDTAGRVELSRRDLRDPLAQYVAEMLRVLSTHGRGGLRILGEAVRKHGRLRFEQGYSPADLVRELHALGPIIINLWGRKQGTVPVEIALLVEEITVNAVSGAVDDYVKQVRASRAHLREHVAVDSLVRHIAEGLLAVERDGTISFATPPAARILGVSELDLTGLPRAQLGRLVQRIDLRDEDGRPLAPERLPFMEALASGRPTRQRRLRLTRPVDGQARIIETDAIPILEDGELRGVVQTIRDRTDEAGQREALRRAYEELRRLHVRLLRRSRAQILGEVATGVAGSLKNVMNAIRLRCDVAMSEGADAKHIAPIQAAIDEMARTVSRLQAMAIPSRSVVPAPVDLDDVTREAIGLVRPEISALSEGRRLEVETRLGAGEPGVTAVRSDLRDLIVNVLLAAIEAEEPRATTLSIATERAGDRVRLIVRGVPRDASVTLSTLAPTVEPWGGTVRFEGDQAIVELEAAPAEKAAPAPPPAAPPAAAHTVLVVDDDEDNREMLAAVLVMHGLRVLQAGSFAEAHAALREGPVDAALLDLAMPDGSGWDLARELHDREPHLRIAVVTGYDTAAAARPDGVAVETVFSKPVDLDRLLVFLGRPPQASGDRAPPFTPEPARGP
jgi:CheY-like chemotaxis protein